MKLIITENQLTKLIESFNINQNSIDELMRLIVSDNRLVPAYNKIYEQPDTVMDRRVGIEDRNMKALGLDPSKPSDRNIYLFRVYGKAVPEVMEEFRTFLFSNEAFALQMLGLMTGFGAVAIEMAWGLMLLYDLFLLANGNGNYNHILIDLICLLSAGTTSKLFSNIYKTSAKTIGESLTKLNSAGLLKNPTINKILSNIKGYSQSISGWINQIGSKFQNSKALKQINNYIADIKMLSIKIIDSIYDFITKNLGKVIDKTVQKFVSGNYILGLRPEKSLTGFYQNNLTSLTQTEVTVATLKIIDAYVEKLKNVSIETVLNEIDKKFGTPYANLFRIYVSGKIIKKQYKDYANTGDPTNIVRDVLVYGSPAGKHEYHLSRIASGGENK